MRSSLVHDGDDSRNEVGGERYGGVQTALKPGPCPVLMSELEAPTPKERTHYRGHGGAAEKKGEFGSEGTG